MGDSLGMLWEGERGGESGIKGEGSHWMVSESSKEGCQSVCSGIAGQMFLFFFYIYLDI